MSPLHAMRLLMIFPGIPGILGGDDSSYWHFLLNDVWKWEEGPPSWNSDNVRSSWTGHHSGNIPNNWDSWNSGWTWNSWTRPVTTSTTTRQPTTAPPPTYVMHRTRAPVYHRSNKCLNHVSGCLKCGVFDTSRCVLCSGLLHKVKYNSCVYGGILFYFVVAFPLVLLGLIASWFGKRYVCCAKKPRCRRRYGITFTKPGMGGVPVIVQPTPYMQQPHGNYGRPHGDYDNQQQQPGGMPAVVYAMPPPRRAASPYMVVSTPLEEPSSVSPPQQQQRQPPPPSAAPPYVVSQPPLEEPEAEQPTFV